MTHCGQRYVIIIIIIIITKDLHALKMKSQSMSVAQTIQKERKIQWNSTYNGQLKTTDSKAFVWTGQSWATFWRLQGWFQVPWGRMEGSSMRRGRRRQKPEGQASRWDIVESRVHPPLRTEDSIDPEWLRPGCSAFHSSSSCLFNDESAPFGLFIVR